ncbi:hypothetical protein PBY51_020763 [Eleginops maclovinus]|uniref:Uncharacterized protein n=1 Tax=Eleginops maclovinus TaxID=56733 RepID=A0AAN7XUG9_ELEMC|nr:hypothetical protein PBY51_020763 [Eleginops maclovinus]
MARRPYGWDGGGRADSTRGLFKRLDTCDGVHLEVGWRSHASCKLLCRFNMHTHTGPHMRSCGIVDAQRQNRACDIYQRKTYGVVLVTQLQTQFLSL